MLRMIVCVCKNVSDRQIRAAMADGADSVRALRNELAVSTCCGKCAPQVKQMVDMQDLSAGQQMAAKVSSATQTTVRDAGVRLRSALYQSAL